MQASDNQRKTENETAASHGAFRAVRRTYVQPAVWHWKRQTL